MASEILPPRSVTSSVLTNQGFIRYLFIPEFFTMSDQANQAIGLNICILFIGFGVGSMVFGAVLLLGLERLLLFSVPFNCCSVWPLFCCFEVRPHRPG